MIACVILAAGLSERFGSPKALAKYQGETVIERIQKTLLNTNIEEIVIVLGAHQDQIKPCILKHNKIRVVYNKDYKLGQTSSFKTGVQGLSEDCSGIFLYPVDYPFVQASTVDMLCDVFLQKHPAILVPSFDHQKGHPPIFHSRLKEEILNLDNTLGLNTIVRKHSMDEIVLPVSDSGVVLTFNTPEEFKKITQQLI